METFLRRVFFLRLLLPLAVGIAVGNCTPSKGWWWWGVVLAGCALSLLSIAFRSPYLIYKFRWMRGLAISLVLFGVGVVSIQLQNRIQQVSLPLEAEECTFRLLDIQRSSSGRVRWLIEPERVSTRLWFYPPKDRETEGFIGNCYQTKLSFRPIVNHDTIGRFDYALWSLRRGVTHLAFMNRTDSVRTVRFLSWSDLLRSPDLAARVCRHRSISFIRSLPLSSDESSILLGLTLGDKQAMDDGVKDRFRLLGISHLLAVSGLHVGILFAILLWGFGFLPRGESGRLLRYVLVVAALWGYAAITGFSPSVVRATLMCSFYVVALILRRQNSAAHTLVMTAFVILLFRPSDLFDVGFQLSFTAVAFILLCVHIRTLWWPDIQGWRRKTADFIAVSVGAQVGTLPLILYYFGSFQPLFLLSNLGTLPLIPYIMLSAFAVGFLALIGVEFAFPLFMLHGLLHLLAFVSEQGGLMFVHTVFAGSFDAVDLLFAYSTLGCLAIFTTFRQRKWFIAALTVVLIWSVFLGVEFDFLK